MTLLRRLLPAAALFLFLCFPSASLADPSLPAPEVPDPLSGVLGGSEEPLPSPPLEAMGYSIQVGAFSNLDNAVRLERVLQERGIDAYYFRHESGLYKVRFGNHVTYKAARGEAERLRKQKFIDTFFIVLPEDYTAARILESGRGDLRQQLVDTAMRFLGVPYRWGGTDDENGMDCSGLTMVCYRLNGLNLPRVSRNQFQSGRLIPKEELRKGDLVFFATRGPDVSHVGMYIGEGKFIHAPRTGLNVTIEELSNPYYSRRYVGGRSYLDVAEAQAQTSSSPQP